MLNNIFLGTFLCIGCASVYLWSLAYQRYRNGKTLLPYRPFEYPFGFLDVGFMFFAWLTAQIATQLFAVWLFDINIADLASEPASKQVSLIFWMGAGQLVSTLIVMAIFYLRYHSISIFGLRPKEFVRDLWLGLIAFVMVVPWVLLLQSVLTQFIPYEHLTQDTLMRDAGVLSILATWFTAVLVAPICEEVFFRGVFQGFLQRLTPISQSTADQRLVGGWTEGHGPAQRSATGEVIERTLDGNPYQAPGDDGSGNAIDDTASSSLAGHGFFAVHWPIFASALIFALAHAGQGPAPIPLFFFGLALGYIFHRSGSIVICIVLHMMLNAFSMFWFTLQVLFPAAETDGGEAVNAMVSFGWQMARVWF